MWQTEINKSCVSLKLLLANLMSFCYVNEWRGQGEKWYRRFSFIFINDYTRSRGSELLFWSKWKRPVGVPWPANLTVTNLTNCFAAQCSSWGVLDCDGRVTDSYMRHCSTVNSRIMIPFAVNRASRICQCSSQKIFSTQKPQQWQKLRNEDNGLWLTLPGSVSSPEPVPSNKAWKRLQCETGTSRETLGNNRK